MRPFFFPVLLGLAFVFTGSCPPLLRAQEKGTDVLKKDLEKELEAAHKGLAEKIQKILLKEEERIASLEKALKDKDSEIATLKKKVEELASGKKPEEKPAEAKKGQALLGVA